MPPLFYPTSLAGIDAWRRANATTLDEARKRFMQFVVLESLAAAPEWGHALAFKGGNALRFIYKGRRPTIDLDFTASSTFPDDDSVIRAMFDKALGTAYRLFAVKAKCQRVRRNPPGRDKTFPTYQISVGYQLPNDRYFADFENQERAVSTIVELEITLNDEVCETTFARLEPSIDLRIRVCALEDILAEKLRALLQQKTRNRGRKQDVYDVARMLRLHGDALDRTKLANYLTRKARARNIEPTQSAFDDEVRRRASFEYETLFSQSDPDFIPFETAWQEVLGLVRQLQIPA